MNFLIIFTLWLNAQAAPCERVQANPALIVVTEEQEGTSVVYDGTLEAFYDARMDEWRYYRTDSPYLAREHGYLVQVGAKLRAGDYSGFDTTRPATCDLIPSRPRA